MRSRQRLGGTLDSIRQRGVMRGIQFRLGRLSKIKWPKYGAMGPIMGHSRAPLRSMAEYEVAAQMLRGTDHFRSW